MTPDKQPHIVVLSSLFPSRIQPNAGLFVRERLFRVGTRLPVSVIAPTPWFPLQRILRHWRPHFRPGAPCDEHQEGHDVWFPRFVSIPGLLKTFDGFAMALGALSRLRALRRAGRLDLIDAHFGYPEGYAAVKLGRWLGVPVTITLRGTEARHARDPKLAPLLREALHGASHIFAVADALKRVAIDLGIPANKVEVVGNGVDTQRFRPLDRQQARLQLGLPSDAPILISVGGLVERKGFHRVIAQLPALIERWPGLLYLIVGGPSAEGNNRAELEALVARLGLADQVRFLGTIPPDQLAVPLSAADVFVLSTRNEGWANVFLEAMACGLPVVTTDVGGNREVVNDPSLGIVVPFEDPDALLAALHQALVTEWDRVVIRHHAEQNDWSERVERLCRAFERILQRSRG
ncbi:glycosyltransferase [Thiocystis violacea]|uniref:glycosyltransferase n=1 Tax=Thiocystis violacea TaxID=13725 RepID=UPI001903B2C0|nr:glycosyltransferase [Thiocystis violacea]MBK1724694.1 glycosyl transferase family 1 [Thiocystis violacea]